MNAKARSTALLWRTTSHCQRAHLDRVHIRTGPATTDRLLDSTGELDEDSVDLFKPGKDSGNLCTWIQEFLGQNDIQEDY